MGNAVSQIDPELHVLAQSSPLLARERLAQEVGCLARLLLPIPPDADSAVVVDFPPFAPCALDGRDGEAIPGRDKQQRECTGTKPRHWIVPDPQCLQTGLDRKSTRLNSTHLG